MSEVKGMARKVDPCLPCSVNLTTENQEKAEVFNAFFTAVFTRKRLVLRKQAQLVARIGEKILSLE